MLETADRKARFGGAEFEFARAVRFHFAGVRLFVIGVAISRRSVFFTQNPPPRNNVFGKLRI